MVWPNSSTSLFICFSLPVRTQRATLRPQRLRVLSTLHSVSQESWRTSPLTEQVRALLLAFNTQGQKERSRHKTCWKSLARISLSSTTKLKWMNVIYPRRAITLGMWVSNKNNNMTSYNYIIMTYHTEQLHSKGYCWDIIAQKSPSQHLQYMAWPITHPNHLFSSLPHPRTTDWHSRVENALAGWLPLEFPWQQERFGLSVLHFLWGTVCVCARYHGASTFNSHLRCGFQYAVFIKQNTVFGGIK